MGSIEVSERPIDVGDIIEFWEEPSHHEGNFTGFDMRAYILEVYINEDDDGNEEIIIETDPIIEDIFPPEWKIEYRDDIKSWWAIPVGIDPTGYFLRYNITEEGFRVTFHPKLDYNTNDSADSYLSKYVEEWYDRLSIYQINNINQSYSDGFNLLDDLDDVSFIWKFVMFDPIISGYVEEFRDPEKKFDIENNWYTSRHKYIINSSLATLVFLSTLLVTGRKLTIYLDRTDYHDIIGKFIEQYDQVKKQYMEFASKPLIKAARS